MSRFDKTLALVLAAAAAGCASGGFGEPPALSNVDDGKEGWGKISVTFDISDADLTESHVVIEYDDGAEWQPATLTLVEPTDARVTAGAVRELWPTEGGISVTVKWDTWADGVQLGGPGTVELRLSSFDVDGAGVVATIFVNVNNLHPVLSTVENGLVFPDGVLGLQDPTDQTLTIENVGTGGASLQWTITGIAYREAAFTGWLSQPTSAAPIGAGSSELVTFSADSLTAPLPRGEYHATVTIEDTNAHESPIEIPVQLVVRNQMAGIYIHDGFDVQLTDLVFDYRDGVLTPVSDSFYVKNSGEIATELDWELSDDTGSAAWLSYPLRTSGQNLASAASHEVQLTITDPSSMAPGEHTATITVTGRESNTGEPTYTGDQTVTVTLTVDYPPTIVFGPSSFTFEGVYGSVGPSPLTLYISNSGDRTLNWTVSDDAAWLTLSPLSDSCTSETDQVQVSVLIAGVAAGTYTATITIADGNAQNSPQLVPVTLIIYPF